MKLTKFKLIYTFFLPFIFLPSITFSKLVNHSHHENLLPIGMPKIKNLKNIQSINANCEVDFFNYTEQVAKKYKEKCPLSGDLPSVTTEKLKEKISEGKKVYIYRSNSFSLYLKNTITIPELNPKDRPEYYYPTGYDSGVTLFIEKENNIVDELIINLYRISEFGWTTELDYYIDKSLNIWLLKHHVTEDGTGISLWAHYKIDQNAMKFTPKQIYTSHTKVNFPDNFVVKDNEQNQNELEVCLKDESKKVDWYSDCNNQIYLYYVDKLKQKIALLDKKKKAKSSRFQSFKKKSAQLCLNKQPQLDNDRFYFFINEVFSCEIAQLKREINQIEIELEK
jgi:hypothetical protein